jgi:hypothetical protein
MSEVDAVDVSREPFRQSNLHHSLSAALSGVGYSIAVFARHRTVAPFLQLLGAGCRAAVRHSTRRAVSPPSFQRRI